MDKKIGSIGWVDLTVPNAKELKAFYEAVVGWKPEPVSMGDYDDYTMTIDGEGKTGLCHKQGPNENIPSGWMIYINVAHLDESLNAVDNNGGKALSEIKDYGTYGRACIIEDPSGAICTLFEPK